MYQSSLVPHSIAAASIHPTLRQYVKMRAEKFGCSEYQMLNHMVYNCMDTELSEYLAEELIRENALVPEFAAL